MVRVRSVRPAIPSLRLAACTAGLLLCLAACAGTPAVPAAPAAKQPAGEAPAKTGLQASLARESEPAKSTSIEAPDGAFKATIAGAATRPFETVEGVDYLEIDIGTGAPVQCSFFPDQRDFADSLESISNQLFDRIAKTSSKIDLKRILRIHAGTVGDAPYLTLHWLLRFGKSVAQLKLAIGSAHEHSIYCLHDQVGYTQTFERFFSGMLQSIEYKKPDASKPYFEQISLYRAENVDIGFAQLSMTRTDAGDTLIRRRTSVLVPAGPDSLQATDISAIEQSRFDGTLVQEHDVEVKDGKPISNLAIAVEKSGAWKVKGSSRGKKVDESFESEQPLLSSLGEYLLFRRFAKSTDPQKVRYARWLTLQPKAPTEHTLSRTESKDGAVHARVEAGPSAFDIVIDDKGVRSGHLVVGKGSIDIERVFVQGSF